MRFGGAGNILMGTDNGAMQCKDIFESSDLGDIGLGLFGTRALEHFGEIGAEAILTAYPSHW